MVHTFFKNDNYIALDVNSGSIYLVAEIIYSFLKEFPNAFPSLEEVIQMIGARYSDSEINEAYQEIESLTAEKLLYSPEIKWDELLKESYYAKGLKALCLHVAHDCNLECEYCFASKGDYQLGSSLMTVDTAFKAIDFLVQHSELQNLEIDFFGGEPLLNFEVVKAAVSYGRDLENSYNKKLHFTITTNGTLLNDDIIDYINQNIDNVVISIDGRKKVHDRIRFYPGKKGSYDRIVPLAQKLIQNRGKKEYYIRGTYTSKNLDFSNDVLHLADLGFKEISIEPAIGKIGEYTILREHLPQIFQEYENLAQEYLNRKAAGKPFRFYHFNLNLYGGPCLYKRISACGAGFEYLAISPRGDIYPCHQFVGQSDFLMGNVEQGIIKSEIQDLFQKSNIYCKEPCRGCWAKFYCSGGCHANSYFSNTDIRKPDELTCEIQRKRIECAIMVEALNLNDSS